MTAYSPDWHRTLRAGSAVRVRGRDEILATLDENGCLDDLPFQPEMLAHCGQRMTVAAVAHKTCDNIEKTGGRWMQDAFHLEGARCDGSLHGGCQADCVFFWKAEWLAPDTPDASGPVPPPGGISEHQLMDSVVGKDSSPDDPTWVCQTTKLYDATELLPWWDIRQYVKDVTSGNHSAWEMVKLLTAATYRNIVELGIGYRFLVALYNRFQKLTGGKPYPEIAGQIEPGSRTPTETLNLEVGEWVQVRSADEIASTITKQGFNRGMRYDIEMLQYSGGKYRVQKRVSKLIDEVSGKMVMIKNPCIQLEDVYCRARCTPKRLGCPRASNTYWREIWLRRSEEP
ncbi:MAG: hypothetical protein RIE06_27935 [Roseibium album]|uniref:hypothetical protein n=1 Tax=Roseibium album TaxID=311410 RepID=UPI0032EE7964